MVDVVKAVAPPRRDRAGRILVRIGGLIAAVFASSLFLYALLILGFADSTTDSEGPTFVATLIVVALAVVGTVLMMLRGGTVWLTLGGIGSLVAGCIALALIYQQGNEWFVSVGQAALVAASAFALSLGAALRLSARRRARTDA